MKLRPLCRVLPVLFAVLLSLPHGVEAKEKLPKSFINPLRKHHTFKALRPFSHDLEKFTNNLIEQGYASEIAVYFRSMNDGVWVGVNEKTRFAPASLMKVPIMMAYLKEAEKNPALLKKKLPAEIADNFDQFISSPVRLKEGELYTVEYLIETMIRDSNNDAMKTLTQHINVDNMMKMYDQLGYSDFIKESEFISLKAYVGTFRVLYNATYLNEKMSEKSLHYLAQTAFDGGLRKGIPRDVVIAHKFGEYGNPAGGKRQLHDVGIVYHPQNPYLLGVMTRGEDYTKLAEAIQAVSAYIYQEVEGQYKSSLDQDFRYQFEDEA